MSKIKNFLNSYKTDIYTFGILTVLFISIAVILGPVYGNLFMDCGREAILPELLLKGKVLFKEIFGMYNPLSYQINACLYLIFGSSFNVLYTASYINTWLIVLGIYLIARIFINEYYSAIFVILMMSIYIFGCIGVIVYIFPYSFAFIYAITFFIFSTYFFLKYIKTDKKYLTYVSSLLLGLSLACKPEFGLCMLPVVITLICKKEKFLNILLNIVLFFIPILVSYSLLFLQGFTSADFKNYLYFLYFFFTSKEQQFYTSTNIAPAWDGETLNAALEAFKYITTYCLIMGLYVSLFFQNKYFKLIGLILIPAIIEYNINFVESTYSINLFCWCIFAILAALFTSRRDLAFQFLAGTSILSMTRVLFLPVVKFGYGIYLLLPILITWILFVQTDFKFINRFKYKKYVSIALIFLSFFNLSFVKSYTKHFVKVETQKGSILSPQFYGKVFNELVDWVNQNTNKNDSVLVMPEGIMLNYVTERSTKLLYYHLIPNHISAIGEYYIIKGLKQDMPDYIIINNMNYAVYNSAIMCRDFGLNICKFVNNNYTYIREFIGYDPEFQQFKAKIYKLNK